MMIPTSFVLAGLSLALALRLASLRSGSDRSRRLWQAFFVLAGIEALLVGLRFGYGVTVFHPLQAMLPLFVGPLIYLGFAVLGDAHVPIGRHLGVAAGLAILPQLIGVFAGLIDGLIMASYGFYLFRLVMLLRAGSDGLSSAPAETAEDWAYWLRGAAAFLGFVLALDLVVTLDFAVTGGSNAPWIIALGTVPILGAFLWFGMSLGSFDGNTRCNTVPASSNDEALAQQLETLIAETSIHRDPDLAVGRLARRLGVPVQELSRAINRGRGMNVSQWINKQRIDEAATMLLETDKSISEIHQRCGFLSRSNFYREFQRIHGRNPGEFRASQG